MNFLSLAADSLWILALAIMAGAARAAWNRIDPETRVPVIGGWRARRNLALLSPIALAMVVWLALLWVHDRASDPQQNVILFGLRATLAAVAAMLQLQGLKKAMATLESEGALKPN